MDESVMILKFVGGGLAIAFLYLSMRGLLDVVAEGCGTTKCDD